MKKIFIKIFLSTSIITIFNYAVMMIASKYIDKNIFGYIILVQSVIAIIVQVSFLGIDFEILRYGNYEKYHKGKYFVNIKKFLLNFVVIVILLTIFFIKSNKIKIADNYILLYLYIVILFLIMTISYILRSINKYISSNILDKTMAISITLITLYYLFSSSSNLNILYYLLSIIVIFILFFSILYLKKHIKLNKVFKKTSCVNSKNVKYQLYINVILTMAVTQFEKIIIGEKLNLEKLALWYVYLQVFKPFSFIGRLFHQVAFPEISHNRFTFTKKKYFKYVMLVILFSIFVYFVFNKLFLILYKQKFNIDTISILIVAIAGFFYLLYNPIYIMLGAKCHRRTLLYNNCGILIISAVFLYIFINYSQVFFPNYLLLTLIVFWILKIIIGIILLKYDKHYSRNQ